MEQQQNKMKRATQRMIMEFLTSNVLNEGVLPGILIIIEKMAGRDATALCTPNTNTFLIFALISNASSTFTKCI